MKLVCVLLFSVALFASSCSKNKSVVIPGTDDCLIVGYTGGYTVANARAVYLKVGSGKLMEDTSQSYFAPPTKFSQFRFDVVCPDSAYNNVKDMVAGIPAELKRRNNSGFGDPVVDMGHEEVWAQINGVIYHWSFEYNESSSSKDVQQFSYRLFHDF